ncbi:hypothetical protein CHLRE_04g224150v5 [Chlamydomonas reinhardtii]|uniref:glycerol kinase n=1 Tax=Chlamydomonas reinhardtii TaxID=3055 RepID=A0A2K3DUH4_CHLRE|nr:uncharacterized protein CHLRE_04g224150v5 [Chlamydomonas reinhardtii]PNW84172.1 hypothetical protein CHLRE_04g224150v5 [Chlamydomonas reinhardtii]
MSSNAISYTECIAALDQGTQSTRVYIFDKECNVLASHQAELPQIYPQAGWCEHDPLEIWRTVLQCISQAWESAQQHVVSSGRPPLRMLSLGITNQRETTVVWSRSTGQPLHNAIVWLDNRTSELCEHLSRVFGGVDAFRSVTGLPISPYFSATKYLWMLENIPQVAAAVESGDAAVGTIDSWLIWQLTGGADGGVHVTDVTNASRMLLMDLDALDWHEPTLAAFRCPRAVLPRIVSNSEVYGTISASAATALHSHGHAQYHQHYAPPLPAAAHAHGLAPAGEVLAAADSGSTGSLPGLTGMASGGFRAAAAANGNGNGHGMHGMHGSAGHLLPHAMPHPGLRHPLSPLEGVPIAGSLGDQMAAVLGARGRGVFSSKLMPALPARRGQEHVRHRLLHAAEHGGSAVSPPTTACSPPWAFKLGPDKPANYALEGSVAVAGLGVSWLRDNLGLIGSAAESEVLAASVRDSGGVYLVPALSGLLAPRWRADARGVLVGLTSFTTRAHVVRAMLEAICFQTREVLDAMRRDAELDEHHGGLAALRVDGGAAANDVLMQMQADLLQVPVLRPAFRETTSMGAALAAGLAVGFWTKEEVFSGGDRGARGVTLFAPSISSNQASRRYARWNKAVERALDLADLAPDPDEDLPEEVAAVEPAEVAAPEAAEALCQPPM